MRKRGPSTERAVTGTRDDDAILTEIRERYDYAWTQWSPIFEEGATDMRYIAGNTWDDEDRRLRQGRLMLTFDQLGQYLNQLVNAIRQNKRAVKVTPDGAGANDQTAEFRANRIRQIEYLSHASEVYTAAFSGAAERSYGYGRIVAEFEPKGFKQRLRLKAIPNPDQVLPDPDAQSVAGRDWKYLFFKYPMSREEFKRDFPDATFRDFAPNTMRDLGLSAAWGDEQHVLVCEYWRKTTTTKTLLKIGSPRQYITAFKDDYDQPSIRLQRQLAGLPARDILDERETEVPVICQYLTNGLELLAKKGKPTKTDWPGQYIPFFACYGKILYMNQAGMTKKIILSFVRPGRSAQKYYNWIKSTEGDVMSALPRTPYMAYEGQMSTEQLALLQSSIHTPVPVVLAKATTEATGSQTVLPLPRRELFDPPVQAYEIAAEAARRDIQNALGRYSSSVGKSDTNVRSGVLQEKLDQQSDQGSYHFVDNFDAMIAFAGEQLDDLIPHYDDTADDVTVRKPNDDVQQVRVNDPDAVDPDTHEPIPYLPTDQGEHTITIGTGPDFDSEREQANAFADALVSGIQHIAAIIGPKPAAALLGLTIKMKNIGPLGEAMEEIVTPPEFQQKGGSPQQAQQALAALQQRLQHAEQAMQQTDQQLQQEKSGNAVKLQIAQMDNATKQAIAAADREASAADREVRLAVAELQAKVKDLQLFYEERARLGLQAHTSAEAMLDRVHDVNMSALDHTQTLAQADQGVQGQLAVQAAQPDPAPPQASA